MDKAAGDDGSGRLMVVGVFVRGTKLGGAGGRVAETDLEDAELWRLGNAIYEHVALPRDPNDLGYIGGWHEQARSGSTQSTSSMSLTRVEQSVWTCKSSKPWDQATCKPTYTPLWFRLQGIGDPTSLSRALWPLLQTIFVLFFLIHTSRKSNLRTRQRIA
ncbi:hypothetical protein V6N12_075729 [Hibiscus sabdariffa]|uniref:Uncharacterized protein n=1 Tax=Hibiscus sabdariffa TaxID=183260 RepID=A0ABR2C8V2_9ROSI